MKKTSALTFLPGVIGLYYLVHSAYYARALVFSSPLEILFAVLLVSLYASILILVVARTARPANSVIASLIMAITLFYGYFRDQFFVNPAINAFVRTYFWNKNNTFFILTVLAISWIIIRMINSRPDKSRVIAKYLTLFLTILGCMDIAMFYHDQSTLKLLPTEDPGAVRLQGKKPDVYFIIFDSETSSKSVKRYWGYSNDSIEQALTGRGFYVGRENRSNYNWTPYSIASTLNMSYLADNSVGSLGEESPRTIDCGVLKIFAANGYSIHNLSFLDINGYPRLGSVAQYSIWLKTLFYFLYDRMSNYTYVAYRTMQMNLLNATYDSMASVIESPDGHPAFIYAHFFIPHTPTFVDETGREKTSGIMDAQDMKGYLGQVRYSYTVALRLVEKILRASNGKAIIIIQGDHGYRFLEGAQKMDEQFDVFKAVYFPNRDYALFTDSTTSVNTFRVVFNSQFGSNLPLLRDSSFNVLANALKRFR